MWYRFVDQPAIARLGLDSTVAKQLQTLVEAWQAASGAAGVTIPAPAAGTLVTLDPAQLVTPPAGLETGLRTDCHPAVLSNREGPDDSHQDCHPRGSAGGA